MSIPATPELQASSPLGYSEYELQMNRQYIVADARWSKPHRLDPILRTLQ